MVVAVQQDFVDVEIVNAIVLGAMAVSDENYALVENSLEDSAFLYIFLLSNIQFSPLLVSMFYILALRGPERLSKLQMTRL